MLRELRIKNFSVIDEVALELSAGLNVLTGETGAGKSIILNALALISGDRVTSDVIRHNQDEASVEALFEELPESVADRLQHAGIEAVGGLIIKRVISRSGKNRVYVGGSLCPLNLLSELGGSLVHVYGQHEHQALLSPDRHIDMLDAFGNLEQAEAVMCEKFRALSAAWDTLVRARELLEKRKKEKGLLEAQAEELANARLTPQEEEDLRRKKNVLAFAEKLYQGCLEGEELLYEGENALIGRLGRYAGKLREMAGVDGALQPTLDLVESALAQLEEANAQLRGYAKHVQFEPGELERLEDRVAEINRLKRKYNGSVEELIAMEGEFAAELKALDQGAEEMPALELAYEAARAAGWGTAERLSQERRKAARRFKRELEREVKSLGMPETVFEVHFVDDPAAQDELPFRVGGKTLTAQGFDQVEFYFSPNPGEPPKALAKIASGGELSRVMLAVKSLTFATGDVSTLLFDEVDAGIGGAVAEIVGQKLKQVAATHQVICVTHLPQIAALADSHHTVRKEVSRGKTSTIVQKLEETSRIEEVARMLGGLRITDKTRRHAEEMVRGKNEG